MKVKKMKNQITPKSAVMRQPDLPWRCFCIWPIAMLTAAPMTVSAVHHQPSHIHAGWVLGASASAP